MAETELATIGMAVVSSILYSAVFYVKQLDSVDPESFDPTKFISTLIVGIGVGIAASVSGVSVQFETVETELAALSGTIAITDSVVKIIYRKAKKGLEQ